MCVCVAAILTEISVVSDWWELLSLPLRALCMLIEDQWPLSLQVVLPDMELMVNLGDWPLSKVKKGSPPFPMFSWCGSMDTWDIIWPTWDLMKSTIMGMDRYHVEYTVLYIRDISRSWKSSALISLNLFMVVVVLWDCDITWHWHIQLLKVYIKEWDLNA